MKKIVNIFKIIRLKNLLIIALTLFVVRFAIIETYFSFANQTPSFSNFNFLLLVFASVLIAAGGYMLNNYYDVDVDKLNDKSTVIDNGISGRSALFSYYMLSGIGFILSVYISFVADYIYLAGLFAGVILLLYFYNISYKRKPFSGNLMIALLCAFLIYLPLLFEFFTLKKDIVKFAGLVEMLKMALIVTSVFAAFSFLLTLLREMLKDIEDIEGDELSGYTTFPIKYGIKKSKSLSLAYIILLLALITGVQLYLGSIHKGFFGILTALFVNIPLLYMISLLFKAKEKKDFYYLSLLTKGIMVLGIIGMVIFKYTIS